MYVNDVVTVREQYKLSRTRVRTATPPPDVARRMCAICDTDEEELVTALRVLVAAGYLGACLGTAAGRARYRLRLQGRRLLVEVRHPQLALVDRPFLDHERGGRDTT